MHTPNIDALVQTGLELDRFYVHKICSPTRSALQSGRAPIHVNVQNVLPESVNPKDPVGGYQGIPLNMTCIATQLKKANYQVALLSIFASKCFLPCSSQNLLIIAPRRRIWWANG